MSDMTVNVMVIDKPSLISTFLTDGMTIGMTTRVASHANRKPDPTFKSTSIKEFILFCFFISCIVKMSTKMSTNVDKIG